MKRPSIAQVKQAFAKVGRLEAKRQDASDYAHELKVLYLLTHPLHELVVKAVCLAFKDGLPVCCEKGIKNLRALSLDDIWVEFISDWAYEEIGCSSLYMPGGSLHAESLAKLEAFLAPPQ